MTRLTLRQARRVAISASGLGGPRPSGRVDIRHYRKVLAKTGLVQLDSVNVLARAHYVPFFSRLGAYSRSHLDRWLWESREMFEYWGHERSLIPIQRRPLFVHRMLNTERRWIESVNREHPQYVQQVLGEVREKGPLRAADLKRPGRSHGKWWGRPVGKRALEYLFYVGAITVAYRRDFRIWYDLPQRVHPSPLLARPSVEAREAHRRLIRLAVAHCGVATASDLADYYRLGVRSARQALRDLVRSGEIRQVEVEGWAEPAYVDPEAVIPRRINTKAILSPFDPLVWHRPRLQRLFGFHYRIEIYVPRAQRVHGYYVLPFLMGDQMAARVDLKLDRRERTLLVLGSFGEAGISEDRVCRALAGELMNLADWLGARAISVSPKGDLARDLSLHV